MYLSHPKCKCDDSAERGGGNKKEEANISEISITVKYGKGYDDTWANFRAENNDDLKGLIIDFFGVDRDFGDSLTSDELVHNVTQQAHGVLTAVKGLGGTVVPSSGDEAQTGGDAWAAAEASVSAKKDDPLAYFYEQVEAATTRADLKKLWAENQSTFENETLMAAYKAKGKALTS